MILVADAQGFDAAVTQVAAVVLPSVHTPDVHRPDIHRRDAVDDPMRHDMPDATTGQNPE